jgi:copper chaperone CopZ
MKYILVPAIVLSLAAAVFAEEKATLSKVHNCCKKCVAGIEKAVGTVPDAKCEIEKSTVILTADNTATLQKAVDALLAAGYCGECDNKDIKIEQARGSEEKVKSVTVSGMHLCCDKCVKAAQKALKSVKGVESDDMKKGAESFKVEGDFSPKELMAALAEHGFSGKCEK